MFTRPKGLSDKALVSAINAGWNLTIASVSYRAVGFGSHHWDVIDDRGDRRFATVDDLLSKRSAHDEGEDTAFARLRAALTTAQDLRDAGCDLVVAPVPTTAQAPLLQVDHRYAVALYPFVAGESYGWGEFSTPAHRRSVLDMVVTLHTLPATATPHAPVDDFGIPHRDELELSMHLNDDIPDGGPYAARTLALLTDHGHEHPATPPSTRTETRRTPRRSRRRSTCIAFDGTWLTSPFTSADFADHTQRARTTRSRGTTYAISSHVCPPDPPRLSLNARPRTTQSG